MNKDLQGFVLRLYIKNREERIVSSGISKILDFHIFLMASGPFSPNSQKLLKNTKVFFTDFYRSPYVF